MLSLLVGLLRADKGAPNHNYRLQETVHELDDELAELDTKRSIKSGVRKALSRFGF